MKLTAHTEGSEIIELAPKPFLRWAGGKRKLTNLLIDAIPTKFNPTEHRFFEPFVGGGALMLALGNTNAPIFVPGKNLFINDMNPDLVSTYKVIRDEVNELIADLTVMGSDLTKRQFEAVRAMTPRDEVERAARFIYLNKTCFNGLWRVNSSGQFNVPWGKLKNPLIFDEQNLLAVSHRLQKAKITNQDYQEATEKVSEGDFVYFDPPYLPISSSASFSQYAKADFNEKNHRQLAETIKKLKKKKAFVILSNSDTKLTREIFGPLMNLHQISMQRSISAAAGSRKPVNEILGTNFPIKRGSTISMLKEIQ
jgi:DNA adenine methylase